jgi:hypothetical protein
VDALEREAREALGEGRVDHALGDLGRRGQGERDDERSEHAAS